MLLDIFDPKAPPTPIGIDLGTTNSIVAYVRDGRPLPLTNCDGSQLLPSVVHYGKQGEVLVGRSAKTYLDLEPGRTIASAKRFMGRSADDPQTQLLGANRFAPAAPGERVVRFDLGERSVTPLEVSAEILKSLAQSARDQLTNVGGVVITVPAYFDDAQRQATKDAGRLAGLNVLRLLNEPTAAALAYGLEKRVNGTFAVYDLGGGTFDITILSLEDGVFQVRSTGGDSALGGDDMDRAIAERMLTALGIDRAKAAPELIGFLLTTAREVKHGLTEAARVEVELPGPGGSKRLFALSREEFDQDIAPLLARTGSACKRALRDANIDDPAGLDGVILVGGSTRVPRVRSFVAELFRQQPLSDIDPDLVVACGAALQAQLLAEASDEVLLLDVLPLSLGVETMGGGVSKILPRNTSIPTGAKASFTTYADNQTGFEIHVVQGERELAKDCRSLARFTLRGIPPLPAGHARLEVEFRVDENSLLKVEARELTTGLRQEVEVQPSYGLDDQAIEDMLLDALDHGEADFEAGRRVEAAIEAERMLLATRKALTADGDLLEAGERGAVEAAMAELRAAIDTGKGASALQLRIEDLDRATHGWAARRMDRAIAGALAGKELTEVAGQVQSARGVEAHLREHAGLPAENAPPSDGVG